MIGGGGVAAVTRSYAVWYAAQAERLGLRPLLRGPGLNTVPVMPGPPELESTTTHMVLTLGGGASFLLTEHVAVDTEAGVLRLSSDQTRTIGRFGVGVSYRF